MDLAARIEAHIARSHGAPVRVKAVAPLPGGACQDNLKVELDEAAGLGARWVLRSDARSSLAGSIDRAKERTVIEAAVAAGVKTPEARWPAKDLVREGAHAYFLAWREGEAIGRRVVKAPALENARRGLAKELACELAKIHRITPASHPDLLDAARAGRPGYDPARMGLAWLRAQMDGLDPSPSRELILHWLDDHAPAASEVTLIHGDFRTGNFLVTPEGLSAILDWEFAKWGSPYFDLAWICVRDWRFGQLDRPVGGFAKRSELYPEYEQASGRKLDRHVLLWWEVYGNLAWAVGSVQQALRYISGAESDIELVAIGRRAAEMEFEALRLLERGAA
jgi:aminoglycoside phosphotransferase (APT) family kinase protein